MLQVREQPIPRGLSVKQINGQPHPFFKKKKEEDVKDKSPHPLDFPDFQNDWYLEQLFREEENVTDLTQAETQALHEKAQEERRRQKEIPALFWLHKIIKIDDRELTQALSQARNEDEQKPYQVITVRKRGGGRREICMPSVLLKKVQRRINKHILNDFSPAKNVYGFSGGNIVGAILPHLKARSILCVDITNAFPSIKTKQIMDFFTEGREVWYGNKYPGSFYGWRDRYHSVFKEFKPGYMSWYAARVVTQLVTYQGKLPQGAPTSPRLFDLICRYMDKKLTALAERTEANYTRYADNIFFSMNEERFPKPVMNAVLRKIRKVGFRPHKVHIRSMNNEALHILGLNIIDGEIHNTRDVKRALRLSIHHANWLLNNGKTDTPELETAWQKLRGQMNFARIDTLPQKLLNDYLELEKQLK